MNQSRGLLAGLAVLFAMSLAPPASAYIDGGTGSMLLQVAISGVLGALFLARSFFRSLPSRFRKTQAPESVADFEEEERKAA